MPSPGDEKDSIQLLYAPCLFLATDGGDEVAAPVVILQNDPANIYSVLETHIHPNHLPQPDKFWKIVRNIQSPAFETYRPRVYGVQIKMLQCARLPYTAQEWASVGEALSSMAPYLQSNSSPETLLRDLQIFVRGVEQWWAGRKREGSGGAKRAAAAAAAANGLLQPPSKRLAGENMLPVPTDLLGGPGAMPLDPNFLPGTMQLNDQQGVAGLALPPMPNMAGLPGNMPKVFSMNNLGDLPLPEPAVNGNGSLVMPHANGVLAANGVNHNHNSAGPAAGNSRKIIVLNVGGKTFSTTLSTMAAVEGSYLWKLAQKARSSSAGEFFLDRSGELFHHIIEYLRCERYSEDIKHAVPKDAESLRLLQREAAFYRLPALEAAIGNALATSASSSCDALFLQTGFIKDGEKLEKAHSELMLRLNTEMAAKARQGFASAPPQCGTETKGDLRNIWAHVLLTKIV